MYTYYLLDHEYMENEEDLTGAFGHLLVYNPGPEEVELRGTVFFEDREPAALTHLAPPRMTSESNYRDWPVEPDVGFALMVESERPVICQSTVGCNNSKNNYRPGAPTRIEPEVRECAKSYMAIDRLATDWFLVDNVIIDTERIWVRESEWVVLLNPGDQPARATMSLQRGQGDEHQEEEHQMDVPARRIKCVYMDDFAPHRFYGVHIASDQPVAVHKLRAVFWTDRPVLMAFWSVPGVPGPLA